MLYETVILAAVLASPFAISAVAVVFPGAIDDFLRFWLPLRGMRALGDEDGPEEIAVGSESNGLLTDGDSPR